MNRFVELIPKQCAKYGEREALRFRDYETQAVSYTHLTLPTICSV